tara:strand:+ start:7952 stop:8377 length:426 start_codon:yes stop_codon:yes gene_type:complete
MINDKYCDQCKSIKKRDGSRLEINWSHEKNQWLCFFCSQGPFKSKQNKAKSLMKTKADAIREIEGIKYIREDLYSKKIDRLSTKINRLEEDLDLRELVILRHYATPKSRKHLTERIDAYYTSENLPLVKEIKGQLEVIINE